MARPLNAQVAKMDLENGQRIGVLTVPAARLQAHKPRTRNSARPMGPPCDAGGFGDGGVVRLAAAASRVVYRIRPAGYAVRAHHG
jgi:hypothetical protein